MDVLMIIIPILVVLFVFVVIRAVNKKGVSKGESNNSIKNVFEQSKEEILENSNGTPLYYVKYEGSIKIGINVEKIKINIDEERKKVFIMIPKAEILDTSIDDTEFNTIYFDQKEISKSEKDFYKIVVPKCEVDMVNDIMNNSELFEMANKNTKEIINGFVTPLIKHINNEYTVEIIGG